VSVESYLKSKGKQIKQVLYNPRTSSTRIKQDVRDQSYDASSLGWQSSNEELTKAGASAQVLHAHK